MKKLIIMKIIILCLLMTTPVLALNTPEVAKNHGVITGMIVSDAGLSLGFEYGLTSEIALLAEIGDPITRLGGKLEVNPQLAVIGGLNEDDPFLGINGAAQLKPDLTGAYELTISNKRNDLSLLYNLGVKLNLDQNVDLRAGLIGFLGDEDFPELELGIGYKF